MLSLITRRSAVQAPFLARSASSIITRPSTTAEAATPAAKATASISTAAQKAANATQDYVQKLGRVTSLNRTFHHTASWEAGSDADAISSMTPAARKVQEKMEQARQRRFKGAMEML